MKYAPVLGLALFSAALAVTAAHAGFPIPEPPLPARVALADCVVVGEVTGVNPEPVLAPPDVKVPGAPKVPYTLAAVRVGTVVIGDRNLRELRAGYVVPARPARPGQAALKWAVGQQACFFLHKHPDESFYVARAPWDVLERARAEDFNRQLALVKRCARLLADPASGLRAKEADDRLLTAGMLIFRYRTARYVYRGTPRTEAIDAEQSRLILSALAEGPWSEKEGEAALSRRLLFFRLGLTATDGWRPPASAKDLAPAARAWLRANAATYRIRRYAPPD
jgi:hypothetical protein